MQLVLNKKLRKALKRYKFENQKTIFDWVNKMVYNGKGKLNDYNVFEKMKLLELQNFELSRIERKWPLNNTIKITTKSIKNI